ncbi:MAG: Sensor histidine kinase YpdA [Firmicutes bacterium]|nr:Sensor histidine kinase YpdA [candidate division NPL-UPA2 bacterium]
MSDIHVKIMLGLVNSLSLMFVIAFLLSNAKPFRRAMYGERQTLRGTILLAVVFGLFGILGTYHGFPVDGAIANSRAVAVVAAGLWAGPAAGIGAGLIAGLHRYAIDIGGFTAFACGLATVVKGVVGALAHRYFIRAKHRAMVGFWATVLGESLQMLIILGLARPFTAAVSLVEKIGLPMIFMNAVGVALFVLLQETIYRDREREAAYQSELALKIANKTLPILRRGLSRATATAACKIILAEAEVDAVAITEGREILSHFGAGADHHQVGEEIQTHLTELVLATGRQQEAQVTQEIGCLHPGCPLQSAIIVPLTLKGSVVGSLKLYRTRSQGITPVERQLAEGLGSLFSTQLELAEKDMQEKLLASAELRALQAQINPHFLFNALNTVVSFCRTQPETARRLLLNLADLLRQNFVHHPDMVTLSKELEHVEAYLEIEKARFSSKLQVEYDLKSEDFLLPPFILQPLVENAVRHGIQPHPRGGVLHIAAESSVTCHTVTIQDSGVGFDINNAVTSGNGIGLSNVNQRLRSLYGPQFGLDIRSILGQGTTCQVRIPRREVA